MWNGLSSNLCILPPKSWPNQFERNEARWWVPYDKAKAFICTNSMYYKIYVYIQYNITYIKLAEN